MTQEASRALGLMATGGPLLSQGPLDPITDYSGGKIPSSTQPAGL